MTNTILEIADEIFFELGNPDDTSIAAISFWLRSNVGGLNSKIGTSYTVNETSPFEFNTNLGDSEKYIFKKMFYVYWYTKLMNANLGAAAYSAIIEYSSDGDTIRKINKNEIAKTHLQLRNKLSEELTQDVSFYKKNGFIPLHVFGDDIFTPELPNPRVGVSRNGLTQNDY